jgi:hypothetical protein
MELEEGRKSFFQQIFAWRERIGELATGMVVMYFVNLAFDYLLYPYVIYRFGTLRGGVVMTFLSFLACLITLWFYDWSKRDWLGIEAVKSLKEYDGNKLAGKLTSWILQKSDPVVFLFLSLKFDPFITMVYLRHGAFNGMNKRDWQVFTGSLLFSNLYWIFICYSGISLVEWVVMKMH